MKYIDAEKLKELIDEKWKDLADKNVKIGGGKWDAEISTYLSVLRLINSLQQEPRFPQYDNIVDKVFGAGNLEGFEYHEAEMLVALAKEELLKSLQQEQPDVGLEEEYKTWWNSIAGKINVEHIMEWYMHETARHFYELGASVMRERITNTRKK